MSLPALAKILGGCAVSPEELSRRLSGWTPSRREMTMVRNGWLLALLLGLPGRAPAQGGTAPKTLYACYLPQSGVVYRVAETDLRFQTPACASQNHVLFSWNDKGEKGDPGNLALAGHTCPAGQFVTGFGTTGGLVCSALFIGGTPPDQYVGQWTLQPAFGAVCTIPDDDLLSGGLSFATMNTGFMGAGTIVMSFRWSLPPRAAHSGARVPDSHTSMTN